jgi:hypothetical protein
MAKNKKTKVRYPKGWDAKRVQEVIDYYDNQTDEEGAKEIEEALAKEEQTILFVPKRLVPAIKKLVAQAS